MERLTFEVPRETFELIQEVSKRRGWNLDSTLGRLLFRGLVTEALGSIGVKLVGRMPDGSLLEISKEKRDG